MHTWLTRRLRPFPWLMLISMLLLLAACNEAEPDPTPTLTAPTAAAETETTEAMATAVPTPSDPTAIPAPETAAAPTFEPGACQFPLPGGVNVVCGAVVVPEDRENIANGRSIRLHVAVFPSTSDNPAPDPIVYLEGGPGGYALETVQYRFGEMFAPLVATRDLVIFDQRGVGASEPALDCPELRELGLDLLDDVLTDAEALALESETAAACRDRLLADGVALSAYNSRENAADVEAVRQALGYDTWNLYGISYGTRLALTVMRDHPAGVRSVVLDSTFPLSVNLSSDLPANMDRAFDTLFAGCAADADCAAAFPDLEDTFFTLVGTLNETPATVPATDFLAGVQYEVAVSGELFMLTLFEALYNTTVIPALPLLIDNASNGDFALLSQQLSNSITNGRFISQGMYRSVLCQDEIAFGSVAETADAYAAQPQLETLFSDPSVDFVLCDLWGVGTADPIENEPVRSDIPTLILAGEYDPVTPPAWGAEAGDALSQDFYFEYPGVGHGATLTNPCGLDMMLAFLDDPNTAPDDACIDEMSPPAFLAPTSADVDNLTLVSFESDLGLAVVTGVAPEGWEEQFPGVFARGSSGLDATLLLQQWFPATSAERVRDLLAEQLQLGDSMTVGEPVEANGRSWQTVTAVTSGAPVNMALVDDGGGALIVLLISNNAAEQEALVDAVFLPALAALERAE